MNPIYTQILLKNKNWKGGGILVFHVVDYVEMKQQKFKCEAEEWREQILHQ